MEHLEIIDSLRKLKADLEEIRNTLTENGFLGVNDLIKKYKQLNEENAKLIKQGVWNDIIIERIYTEKAKLEAEREQWMKQKPYRYFNESNMSNVTVDQWEDSRDLQCYYTLPLYRNPLPAQQVPLDIADGLENPISLRQCLKQLVRCAEILLDERCYDGHGHEVLSEAKNRAYEYLSAAPKPEDK